MLKKKLPTPQILQYLPLLKITKQEFPSFFIFVTYNRKKQGAGFRIVSASNN
jgi:hypothetical protein